MHWDKNPSQCHLANRPGINTALREEKPATNCTSHSTAILSAVSEEINTVLSSSAPFPKEYWLMEKTQKHPPFF